MTLRERYSQAARCVTSWSGSPIAASVAFITVLAWAITGPLFGFSATWQLVINTGTTIVPFLMVFLIQNSQNRDSRAIQLKLDELIRAIDQADNRLMHIEDAPDGAPEEGEGERKSGRDGDEQRV